MIQYYVYIHTRPSGEPFYVGKGKGRRCNEFRGRSIHHGNVVAKHGRENIKIKLILCASEEAAIKKEIALIKRYRKLGFRLVNQTDGGEGISGLVHSQAVRDKLSAIHKGKTISDKHRAQISAAVTGRVLSAETKAKISAAKIGIPRSAETKAKLSQGLMGKRLSAETKEKLSIAGKRAWADPTYRSTILAARKSAAERREVSL